jgi:Helix-turn-helix domain
LVVAAMSEFNKIGYLKCARGMKLKAAGFVLAVLYSYSDPDGGNIRPGIKRLAADCCMSESTVSAHLKLLIDLGLIREEDRGGSSWNGRTWASTYRLCVPHSTSENSGVDKAHSTSENLEVDNHSTSEIPVLNLQNFVTQPPEFRPSTSEISEPTKVLPSSLPRGAGEVAHHNAARITPPSGFCPDHPHGEDPDCRRCWDRGKYRREWTHTPEGKAWLLREETDTHRIRIQAKINANTEHLDSFRDMPSIFTEGTAPALEGTNGYRPQLESLPDLDSEAEEPDPDAPICATDGCTTLSMPDGLFCGQCSTHRVHTLGIFAIRHPKPSGNHEADPLARLG